MRVANLLPILAVTPVVTATLNAETSHLTARDLVAIERSIEARGLANDIWNKIKNAATCTGCQGILLLLKGLAAFGDGAFVGVVKDICKLAKVTIKTVSTHVVKTNLRLRFKMPTCVMELFLWKGPSSHKLLEI